MSTTPSNLNCILLNACGAAYNVKPGTNVYAPDPTAPMFLTPPIRKSLSAEKADQHRHGWEVSIWDHSGVSRHAAAISDRSRQLARLAAELLRGPCIESQRTQPVARPGAQRLLQRDGVRHSADTRHGYGVKPRAGQPGFCHRTQQGRRYGDHRSLPAEPGPWRSQCSAGDHDCLTATGGREFSEGIRGRHEPDALRER